jgi:hypothetical protein
MNLAKSWPVLLTLVACSAYGADSRTFEARYQKSISTPQGQEYEMKAVQAFWGDAGFMRECAPPNTPIAEPLTIYFEVKPDGGMGQLVISPETKVANCIVKNVKNRRFPKPPNDYVVKIDLNFTK